jgi:hypothetical protein
MAKGRKGGKRSTVRKKEGSAKRKPLLRAKVRQGKKLRGKKSAGKKTRRASVTTPRGGRSGVETPSVMRGIGPDTGGQSGDTEGLSRAELAGSESVEELLEEGQAFEAGVISGVESAPDADRGGVRTRQVPEDDVPQEYLDED